MDSEQDSPQIRKPPLGVCPPDIYEWHRCKDLARAIHERLQLGHEIKREWITELGERYDRATTMLKQRTFPTEF